MVCALYIPEVQFANVLTMEPIVLQYVPHDRFNKVSSHGPLPVRESLHPSGQWNLILSNSHLQGTPAVDRCLVVLALVGCHPEVGLEGAL